MSTQENEIIILKDAVGELTKTMKMLEAELHNALQIKGAEENMKEGEELDKMLL